MAKKQAPNTNTNTPLNASGLESVFAAETANLKKRDALYAAANKRLEAQKQVLDGINKSLTASNNLSKDQVSKVQKTIDAWAKAQSIQAKALKDYKEGNISAQGYKKTVSQITEEFNKARKGAKLTGKENKALRDTIASMKTEMQLFGKAVDETAKNIGYMDTALDHLGSSGIPLMNEFADVIKNAGKNAEAAKIALTALGAAAGALATKYFGAEMDAAIKAANDAAQNNISAQRQLAKLDNKQGFIKQRAALEIHQNNIDNFNELSKLDNKKAFVSKQIGLEVNQNSIDTANEVNRLTIDAAHASQRAAIQFSAQMQTGAAEFQAAAKTALFGKSLGSIGYGAAQMQLAGVGAENVASSLSAASKALGNKVSSEIAADMAVLEKRTGASSDNISSMVSFFKRANKVSAGTALNMVEGMRAMADSANIDLGGLMEEVASASKEALGYQIKSGPALQKQVAYAQQLGVSFNDVAKAGKSMVLNYKDSIKNEMELSAMLGRNVNLSEARALFAQGKTDDALKSIKAQGLDPSKMNMFQQESLSKALGGLDLDSLQKIATGNAKDVSAQTGNVKGGNKGFLSATQSAQSTLAAQQASISAQTAIIDAKLSGQITKAYLESDGYKQYQKNLLQQQKDQAKIEAEITNSYLKSPAYAKYQAFLINQQKLEEKLNLAEENKFIQSADAIRLAAEEAKLGIKRSFSENVLTAAGAIGGGLIGNFLGKKIFGNKPTPVTIVDGGPLEKLQNSAGNKLFDKVKNIFSKKGVEKATTKATEKATAKLTSKATTKLAEKTTTKAVEKVAVKATEKVVAKTAAKTLGKSLIKKIPFLGLAAGLVFAGQRAMAGDYSGAALEVASGGASMIPGGGTAASIGIDAMLAARDLKEAGVIGGANPKGGSSASKAPAKVAAAVSTKPSLVLNDVQYQTRLQTEMVALLGMSSGFLKQLLEVSAAEFDRPININGTKLNANLLSAARKNYAVARKEAVGAYKAP